MLRRWFFRATLAVLALAVLTVGAGIFLMRGSEPLHNGERLADGSVEIVADGFIAAYIVNLPNDSIILVDAGFDPDAAAIKDALARRGRTADDIVAIFFTHGHGDHIAGALAFPNAALFALTPDADLIEGRRVAQSPFARNRNPTPTGLKINHLLTDGDRIDIGDATVEAFALPGHTLGSAAYLIHGVLFLGDSAAARSDGKIMSAPPVFSWDRDVNQESLRRLALKLRPRADEIDALAFGHQGPLDGPYALFEWAETSP